MKKDIKSLVDGIDADIDYLEPLISKMNREKSEGRKEWHEGLLGGLRDIRNKIDQLDEPEVTLDRAFEKVAESYPMTREEICRHLERLGAHGGKVTYGEPEVLSQAWIDKNKTSIDLKLDGTPIYKVREEFLQNLLVPKQELPVIPKSVAEVIVEHKERGYDVYDSIDLIIETNGGGLPSISDWIAVNIDKYARAWLDGFTVEKEQKYIVVLGKSIYNTTTYGQIGEVNSEKIMQSMYASKENIITPNQYTKSEILEVKDGGDIFKKFAVKVEELEEWDLLNLEGMTRMTK